VYIFGHLFDDWYDVYAFSNCGCSCAWYHSSSKLMGRGMMQFV